MHILSGRLLSPLVGLILLAACGSSITIKLPEAAPAGAQPPKGYSLLYSPAPHAFRFAESPEPVRRGTRSERFELREGDCGGSDCGAQRARAEIIENPQAAEARLNRDIWYGMGFYNGSINAVTADTALGTTILQWKQEGELPPIFRFVQVAPNPRGWAGCSSGVCTPGGAAQHDVVVQLDAMAQAAGWGPAQNGGRICRLFSMAEAQGRWTDIVINTNFGTDAYGYLRVWVDGALRCDYRGQLVPPGSTLPPTNRRGIFNSYTARWAERFGATPKPTLIAYFDEFRAGASRVEVDPRVHDLDGTRPVD